MNDFDDETLRAQLRAKDVKEPILVKQFHVVPGRENNRGEMVSTRSYLRWLYSIRLDNALRNVPQRTHVHESIRATLAALELTADDEPIYSWEATARGQKWGGFSTSRRLILTMTEDLSPDSPNHGILRITT